MKISCDRSRLSWSGALTCHAGNVSAEYALIAVLIGVVIVAGVQTLGSGVSTLFNSISNSFNF